MRRTYAVFEPDPDGTAFYTLWGETTDLDEAIDAAKDTKGYVQESGEIIADYRED